MVRYIEWDDRRAKQLVDLWNDEIGGNFPMRMSLFLQNTVDDHNLYLPGSWIAIDEHTDQVVGFVSAKIWQEERGNMDLGHNLGWIQSLLVRSAFRKRGIGSHLLQTAESALLQGGATQILLGRDPWHYFPGVPSSDDDVKKWFEIRGFVQSGVDHDLYRLNDGEYDCDLPLIDGVQFRLLESYEQEKLLSLLHRCFPGRWEYEAIHYFERGGTGREFVILEKEGEMIGFCRINDASSPFIAQNTYWAPLFEDELGGIGPLGIDREHRKNGYGLAIVQAGTYFLQERGIKRIVIDWTGLVEFYNKLGFNVWKSYIKYVKS